MTARELHLCERLKRLGFSREKQIRLYGSQFELVGDPIVMSNSAVFIDGIEQKSGLLRRVRIPLTMAAQQIDATFAASFLFVELTCASKPFDASQYWPVTSHAVAHTRDGGANRRAQACDMVLNFIFFGIGLLYRTL